MSIKLTKEYIDAFNNKDLERISNLVTNNFTLEDPVVKKIEGKVKVLEAINTIFESCKTLTFEAKNIYQDKITTIIEFILKLDGNTLFGIDVIEWEGNKMKELRAYLDIPKG